jgi:hypothetical protein
MIERSAIVFAPGWRFHEPAPSETRRRPARCIALAVRRHRTKPIKTKEMQ